MYEISVTARFSGAHRLKGYEGPCGKLHGHNWEVEVFLRGKALDDIGMLVDFRKLKGAINGILEDLDHSVLNETGVLGGANPTSENLAGYLYDVLSGILDCSRYAVSGIRVSETDGTSASYIPEHETKPVE